MKLIADDLQRALHGIDLILSDDVIDNRDFDAACGVESDLRTAAITIDDFIDHRARLAPRLRLLPPPQLELPGMAATEEILPPQPVLRVVL